MRLSDPVPAKVMGHELVPVFTGAFGEGYGQISKAVPPVIEKYKK